MVDINKIYDEMDLQQLVCRIPSKMAIDAIKRRITNVEGLLKMFHTPDGGGAHKCKEVKEYVNSIFAKTDIDDIFDTFDSENYPILFKWLDHNNSKRILNEGGKNLTIEFLYNLSDKNSLNDMTNILDRILGEKEPKISHLTTMLNKVEKNIFESLVEKIIEDDRLLVKTSILSVYNKFNDRLLSDQQKITALQALAQIPNSVESSKHISPIKFELFNALEPLEKIMALDKYLDFFPKFKQIKVFKSEIKSEDLKENLETNDSDFGELVEEVVLKYKDITEK